MGRKVELWCVGCGQPFAWDPRDDEVPGDGEGVCDQCWEGFEDELSRLGVGDSDVSEKKTPKKLTLEYTEEEARALIKALDNSLRDEEFRKDHMTPEQLVAADHWPPGGY